MQENGKSNRSVSQLPVSVIRHISTGQVVRNVAAACKELIENALDAGATAIDIKVVDYGVTSLEVSDNGSGVQQGDFETLAQAHYTSKIKSFDELSSLKTYGFRGEALNALAALSQQLTVTTRHSSAVTAAKLQFDHNGSLKNKSSCARTVGTTVTVEQFLQPLPVRRKEFERNSKREFQKLLNVVQAYCLISKCVRIELTHRTDAAKKTILSTYPNQTMKENVCNTFGAKQLESLIDFVQIAPLKDQLTEHGFQENAPLDKFRIEGLVSTIAKGTGRSSGDRQFIFANQRPCDIGTILKVINEVYRQYNRNQYPVVILNIEVAEGNLDVNFAPDKRHVLISNEDLLKFVIKISLSTLYDKLMGVYSLGEASSANSIINTPSPSQTASSSVVEERPAPLSLDKFKRHYQPSDQNIASVVEERPAPLSLDKFKRHYQPSDQNIAWAEQRSTADILEDYPARKQFKPGEERIDDTASKNGFDSNQASSSLFNASRINSFPTEKSSFVSASLRGTSSVARNRNTSTGERGGELLMLQSRLNFSNEEQPRERAASGITDPKSTAHSLFSPSSKLAYQNVPRSLEDLIENRRRRISSDSGSDNSDPGPSRRAPALRDLEMIASRRRSSSREGGSGDDVNAINAARSPSRTRNSGNSASRRRSSSREGGSGDDVNAINAARPPSRTRNSGKSEERRKNASSTKSKDAPLPIEAPWAGYRKCSEIPFSFDQLRQIHADLEKEESTSPGDDSVDDDFHARITPGDNERAEMELKRCLKRTDFESMRVVGQFNLGFIIARLRDDLFIIDQHASDEKYNFEMLQKTATFECQKLLTPIPLELSAAQEQIIVERHDVFKKNGFEFIADKTKSPGNRIQLSAIPNCGSCNFDKSDVEEIIAILDDDRTARMYRPKKVRHIFASKACRKSVMVGAALNKPQMDTILRHMSETDQPWNCPHGRPTVRHLLNLRQIPGQLQQDG